MKRLNYGFIVSSLQVTFKSKLGPLQMSLVTRLAWLLGQILWCVHMGNISPVNWDEFKKHNQTGVHKLVLSMTDIAL